MIRWGAILSAILSTQITGNCFSQASVVEMMS